jgi:hypothetical protein
VGAAIIRLVLLLSVLLMPLGMTPAAASPSHRALAGMPMGHCPEQKSRHDRGIAECTMACAAALPVMAAGADELLAAPSVPVVAAIAQRLHGLHPDTATPPPKRA